MRGMFEPLRPDSGSRIKAASQSRSTRFERSIRFGPFRGTTTPEPPWQFAQPSSEKRTAPPSADGYPAKAIAKPSKFDQTLFMP
jgi:hypothetical protein